MLLAQVQLYQEDTANVPVFASCELLRPEDLKKTVEHHPVLAIKTLADNPAFTTLIINMKTAWTQHADSLATANEAFYFDDLGDMRAELTRTRAEVTQNFIVTKEIRTSIAGMKARMMNVEAFISEMFRKHADRDAHQVTAWEGLRGW